MTFVKIRMTNNIFVCVQKNAMNLFKISKIIIIILIVFIYLFNFKTFFGVCGLRSKSRLSNEDNKGIIRAACFGISPTVYMLSSAHRIGASAPLFRSPSNLMVVELIFSVI